MDTFCRMIESVQYNAALAITGAIKGSSGERLYHELGLESLSDEDGTEDVLKLFHVNHLLIYSLVPLWSDPMLWEVIYSEILPHTQFFLKKLVFSILH